MTTCQAVLLAVVALFGFWFLFDDDGNGNGRH
jgi:hypothetical protein